MEEDAAFYNKNNRSPNQTRRLPLECHLSSGGSYILSLWSILSSRRPDIYNLFGRSITVLSSNVSSRRARALISLWSTLSTRGIVNMTLVDFCSFIVEGVLATCRCFTVADPSQFYSRMCPQDAPVLSPLFMVTVVNQAGRYQHFS